MLIYAIVIIFIVCVLIQISLMSKNLHVWIMSYIKQCLSKRPVIRVSEPINVVFCFVDHFEPAWNRASYADEVRRVDKWVNEYPILAARHKDCNGRHPQHTFFYPEEQYRKEHLDKLSKLCKDGFGDVEIHLHHHDDTESALRAKIELFKGRLREHGLLSQQSDGTVTYGFIHGNWALDNSRKDGKWCGINNELTILKETGCYADFTMPSAPSETQTRKINSIYYATDDPFRAKSHNDGTDVQVSKPPTGDLMIIQGPLTLDWKSRKWGFFPRVENGDVAGYNPPTPDRIDLWIKQHIHVKDEPNWIFVKVHTHGCQERHHSVLFGDVADEMYSYLEKRYNDGLKYRLHYMTAREMYDLIKRIEKDS